MVLGRDSTAEKASEGDERERGQLHFQNPHQEITVMFATNWGLLNPANTTRNVRKVNHWMIY